MTQIKAAYWLRIQRRAASYTPDIRAAMLQALKILADGMDEQSLARFISSGQLDKLIDEMLSDAKMNVAFSRAQKTINTALANSARTTSKDLPDGGKINGRVSVTFNMLNPRHIDAIRQLDQTVLQKMKADVREVVRAYIENGLRDGVNPVAVARDLRSYIGLAPNQVEAVTNFQQMLITGDREALTRALRDRRFDATLRKALGQGGTGLSTEQVKTMTDAYARRFTAFNAETNARTAALQAMKLGQQLTWQDAADNGLVDADRLMKRWVGVKDDRERESHLEMEGDTVPFRAPFSNGQMVPGEDEYNCRCVAYYFEER